MKNTRVAEIMLHRIFLFFVGLTFFLVLPVPLSWSHPHVFVYNGVTVTFDKNGLAGFEIRWAFDEMFSSMIILDFDKNRNGRFEPSEIAGVEKGAFSNLREFDYFTHIKIDKKPFKVKYVKDFSAEIENHILIYRFFVPCHVRATHAWKEVKISVYDREFYTSIFMSEHPVVFKNHELFEVRRRIEKNKSEAYFYDQIYPDEATMRFRLKNG